MNGYLVFSRKSLGMYPHAGSEANMSPVYISALVRHPPQTSLYSHTPHLPFKLLRSLSCRARSDVCSLPQICFNDLFWTFPRRIRSLKLHGITSPFSITLMYLPAMEHLPRKKLLNQSSKFGSPRCLAILAKKGQYHLIHSSLI